MVFASPSRSAPRTFVEGFGPVARVEVREIRIAKWLYTHQADVDTKIVSHPFTNGAGSSEVWKEVNHFNHQPLRDLLWHGVATPMFYQTHFSSSSTHTVHSPREGCSAWEKARAGVLTRDQSSKC